MPERTADLELTGRLLIWTGRHWLRSRQRRRDLPGFVVNTLTQLPAGDRLLLRLEALLALLLTGANRPLVFACPEASALTRDERSLLLALSAAASGLLPEARLVLADCQQGAGLRAAVAATGELAAALRDAGLRLVPETAIWPLPATAAAAAACGARTA
ncbi:MAG TPA: hypothetical protein VLA56_00630 [Pseudomonadales bacterium]|nr:hypothetical protein [Pseudomonadales bacterium]